MDTTVDTTGDTDTQPGKPVTDLTGRKSGRPDLTDRESTYLTGRESERPFDAVECPPHPGPNGTEEEWNKYHESMFASKLGKWTNPAPLDELQSDSDPKLLEGEYYRETSLYPPWADYPDEPGRRDYRGGGRRSDCYLTAALFAIPRLLHDRVWQEGDTVFVKTAVGTYKMNASLPFYEDGTRAHSRSGNSMAAAFAQKAAAKRFRDEGNPEGHYKYLASGNAAEAMAWFVGDVYPYTHIVDTRTMTVNEIEDIIHSDLPVCFDIAPSYGPGDTDQATLDRYRLVRSHVYNVSYNTGLEPIPKDSNSVLRNIWGYEDPSNVTPEVLRELKAYMHFGSEKELLADDWSGVSLSRGHLFRSQSRSGLEIARVSLMPE